MMSIIKQSAYFALNPVKVDSFADLDCPDLKNIDLGGLSHNVMPVSRLTEVQLVVFSRSNVPVLFLSP